MVMAIGSFGTGDNRQRRVNSIPKLAAQLPGELGIKTKAKAKQSPE